MSNKSDPKFCMQVMQKVLGSPINPRMNGAFQPDVDANDDYLVLQCVREKWTPFMQYELFCGALAEILQERTPFDELDEDAAGQYGALYEVGDYSRAAIDSLKHGEASNGTNGKSV